MCIRDSLREADYWARKDEQNIIQRKHVLKAIEMCIRDRPRLGALIVPDFESLKEYAVRKNLTYTNNDDLIKKREVLSLFQDEQKRLISKENGFQPFETVMGIALLPDEFLSLIHI